MILYYATAVCLFFCFLRFPWQFDLPLNFRWFFIFHFPCNRSGKYQPRSISCCIMLLAGSLPSLLTYHSCSTSKTSVKHMPTHYLSPAFPMLTTTVLLHVALGDVTGGCDLVVVLVAAYTAEGSFQCWYSPVQQLAVPMGGRRGEWTLSLQAFSFVSLLHVECLLISHVYFGSYWYLHVYFGSCSYLYLCLLLLLLILIITFIWAPAHTYNYVLFWAPASSYVYFDSYSYICFIWAQAGLFGFMLTCLFGLILLCFFGLILIGIHVLSGLIFISLPLP